MLTAIKKSLWFIWHFHRTLVIAVLAFVALSILLLRGLAFYLEENPHVIKNLIEQQLFKQSLLNESVTFDKLSIDTNLLFPIISMQNFRVGERQLEDDKALVFKSASIQINTLHSLFSRYIKIDRLTLSGLRLVIQRNHNNDIFIADFQLDNEKKPNEPIKESIEKYLELFNQTTFTMNNSELYFIDDKQEWPSFFISGVDFEIKNDNDNHQVSLLAQLDKTNTHLDLRLDFTGRLDEINKWGGKIYGSIKNMNQATLLHLFQQNIKNNKLQIETIQIDEVQTDIKFWSDIKKGKLQSIIGDLVLTDTKLSHTDDPRKINFNHVSSNFKFIRDHVEEKNKTLWTLDLFDFVSYVNGKMITNKDIHITWLPQSKKHSSQVNLFVNDIDLEEISPILSFYAPDKLNKHAIKILKPKGHIKNIFATVDIDLLERPIKIKHYQVQADIVDLSINALYSLPKIRHFSSRVICNKIRGRAYINSADIKLHIKPLFRDSWLFKHLSGEFFWQKEGQNWLFGTEQIDLSNDHLNARADVKLWYFKSGRMFMDLSAFYHDINVQFIPDYLPVEIMSDGLIGWLDKAFISGKENDGGVVFRGEFSDYPFADQSGVLDVSFNVENVLLNYNNNWPFLSDINALIQFTGQGMSVNASKSKIFSSVADNIQANIEHYSESIVTLTGDIETNVTDGMQFLKESQLLSENVLEALDAEGDLGLNLDVTLFLKEHKTDSKVTVTLKDNDYYPPGFIHKKGLVSQLKGDIIVHNNDISAKKLTAKIMGESSTINIKTKQSKNNFKKDPNIKIKIDSKVSIKQLKHYKILPELLVPMMDYLQGKSAVKIAVDLPNKQQGLAFKIHSNLINIKSDLPEPLTKSARKKSLFSLSFTEKSKTLQLDVQFLNVLSLALLLESSGKQFDLLRGKIAFSNRQAKLPNDNVLAITGSINHLPIEQWQTILSAQGDTQKKKKEIIHTAKNKWVTPIQLALKNVALPQLKETSTQEKKHVDHTLSKAIKNHAPKDFPLINGFIESIKIGDVHLGRLDIKTHRDNQNIIIDQLTMKGSLLFLTTKGKWMDTMPYSQVSLSNIRVNISSLGKLFLVLGNDEVIRDGKLKLRGNLHWQGGLHSITHKNLKGNFHLAIKKGAWVEGKPGTAGRLLGLLNMNALIRRLSLDFSDVSKKGFEFDVIKADMVLKDGQLKTDNFIMSAPSAQILMTGSTHLLEKSFDQHVTVIPEISATLPLAGAAVAGPAGAAVVWVGQKILGQQINKITAFGYSIKGDWVKPEVKKEAVNMQGLNLLNSFSPSSTPKNSIIKKRHFKREDNNPIFNEL